MSKKRQKARQTKVKKKVVINSKQKSMSTWDKIKLTNNYKGMVMSRSSGDGVPYPLNFLDEFEKTKDPLILQKYLDTLKIKTSWWFENDPCFCDSKIPIWECHLKDKDLMKPKQVPKNIRKKLYHEIINKSPGVEECLIKNCNASTIKSHYIPKNMLKIFGTNLTAVPLHIGDKSKVKGIKLISHKMFCHKHDNDLFAVVDAYPFILNSENIKLFAIRMVYMELTQKITVVENFRKLFLQEISFSAYPQFIESYKGNMLGIRDLWHTIDNLMNIENENIIFREFDSKNKFIAGTCSNPREYSEDNQEMYDQHNWEIIFPVISTIVCPWGKKMLAISIFTKDEYNDKEFQFVSTLTETNLKKWFSGQILDGQNFWSDEKTIDRMMNDKLLENIKIQGYDGTLTMVINNNFRTVPNLFDE